MKRLLLIIATGLVLSGCAGANVNTILGGAYAAQTTLAKAVLAECGNTVPGGDCLPESAISTADKESVKAGLAVADAYTDEARLLVTAGSVDEALTLLERATKILDQLEQILIARGVQ